MSKTVSSPHIAEESKVTAAHKRFIERVKEQVRLRQWVTDVVQEAHDKAEEKNGNPMGKA